MRLFKECSMATCIFYSYYVVYVHVGIRIALPPYVKVQFSSMASSYYYATRRHIVSITHIHK